MSTATMPQTERQAALKGPLALKDPKSVEYAYQMTHRLKTLYQLKEASIDDWDKVVLEADSHRIYERVPPGYPSLDALLEAEIGANVAQSREHVLSRRGRPTKAEQEDKPCNTSIRYGTAEHWIARLKGDQRLDLLARIEAGELSPHAAALEAGYRKVPSQLDKLNQAWDGATGEDRKAFLPKVVAWLESFAPPDPPLEHPAPAVTNAAPSPVVPWITIGPGRQPRELTVEEKYAYALRNADSCRERVAAFQTMIQSIDPTRIYRNFSHDSDPQQVELVKVTAKQYKVSYHGSMYTLDRAILDHQGHLYARKYYDFSFGWYLISMLQEQIAGTEKDRANVEANAETYRLQLAQQEQTA